MWLALVAPDGLSHLQLRGSSEFRDRLAGDSDLGRGAGAPDRVCRDLRRGSPSSLGRRLHCTMRGSSRREPARRDRCSRDRERRGESCRAQASVRRQPAPVGQLERAACPRHERPGRRQRDDGVPRGNELEQCVRILDDLQRDRERRDPQLLALRAARAAVSGAHERAVRARDQATLNLELGSGRGPQLVLEGSEHPHHRPATGKRRVVEALELQPGHVRRPPPGRRPGSPVSVCASASKRRPA